jgi:hypothetical protein
MSMMIPLIMQKKRDQAELAYKDKVLQIKRDELQAEAQERAQKLKDEATKTRVKYLTDMYKIGVEKGDKGIAEQFGTQLLGGGMPVAANIIQPRSMGMGIDPMAERSPAPRLDFLVAQQNEWDDPYEDQSGTTVQKNLKTGEIRKAGGQAGLTGTAKNLEILLGRKPTLNELKEYGQDESKPYFTPVQTSTGMIKFNNRTGKFEPMQAPGGKPLLPVTADPGLAGEKKTAEKGAEWQVERQKTYPKVRDAYKSLTRQWENVDKLIDKALTQISPFTAGVGAWTSTIPATPAKNLKENLETIRANIGFDKLQDMRANSPTGGALGQVSDLENRLLQAVQGSLDQSQSPGQLRDNLNNIKNMVQQVRAQKDFAFNYDFADIIKAKSKEGGPQPGTVEDGYRFKGGDPADSKNWEKVK